MTNLYIQGDFPNTWMQGQDWQWDFLKDLHTSTLFLPFTRSINHGRYTYMAWTFNNRSGLPTMPCNSLPTMNNMPVTSPYYRTISAGVLCNMTTGMCRFYIFTPDPIHVVMLAHPHNGAQKACGACNGCLGEGFPMKPKPSVFPLTPVPAPIIPSLPYYSWVNFTP